MTSISTKPRVWMSQNLIMCMHQGALDAGGMCFSALGLDHHVHVDCWRAYFHLDQNNQRTPLGDTVIKQLRGRPSARTEWIEFTPEEPELGPPKPLACAQGWSSHIWHLRLEDGCHHVYTECQLCNEGLTNSGLLDDGLYLDNIDVTLSVEDGGTPPDNHWPYINLVPFALPTQGDHDARPSASSTPYQTQERTES